MSESHHRYYLPVTVSKQGCILNHENEASVVITHHLSLATTVGAESSPAQERCCRSHIDMISLRWNCWDMIAALYGSTSVAVCLSVGIRCVHHAMYPGTAATAIRLYVKDM